MWKKLRILILLLILLVVAVNAYRDQNQDWSKPILYYSIQLMLMDKVQLSNIYSN